ncbi:hypothetical protein TNCV_4242311 [Trichonephila clavipes]|nr:hypothetical protein TNCV_4242311 [Trichonephila clavipes]
MNRLHLPLTDLVVGITVFYDSLRFIKVNQHNIKKKWTSARSLLEKVETDPAKEEPDEIMHVNHNSENKFEKSDEYAIVELKGKFSSVSKFQVF